MDVWEESLSIFRLELFCAFCVCVWRVCFFVGGEVVTKKMVQSMLEKNAFRLNNSDKWKIYHL